MHDLTQISQQDDRGGNQIYQYSSHSANPAVRRSQSTDAADEAGMYSNANSGVCCSQRLNVFLEVVCPTCWNLLSFFECQFVTSIGFQDEGFLILAA